MARNRRAVPGQLALDLEPASSALLAPQLASAPPQPPVEDQDERLAALEPQRSFIVQAPAGSGKTGLLIQRYLVNLIINGPLFITLLLI